MVSCGIVILKHDMEAYGIVLHMILNVFINLHYSTLQ